MVTDLVVIVPSRGRPDNARALVDTWEATNATADLVIAVDDDDDTLAEYCRLIDPTFAALVVAPRYRLGPTLNLWATLAADVYRHVGFMGDDHRPRTVGWDKTIIDTLDTMGTGIVYGNDLFQGPNLPTAVFMTSNIVDRLGYMVPPGILHLFADNAWKAWGEGIGRLRYLPDTIIEHVHPAAGKGSWDDRYAEVNSGAMWEHDQTAWELYKAQTLASDVASLRGLL